MRTKSFPVVLDGRVGGRKLTPTYETPLAWKSLGASIAHKFLGTFAEVSTPDADNCAIHINNTFCFKSFSMEHKPDGTTQEHAGAPDDNPWRRTG